MENDSTNAPQAHAPDARRTEICSAKQRWVDLIERFEAVEADPVITDESIDEAGNLICQIMAMPAPDAAAAQWKLDWLFTDGDEYTASYAKSNVAQTIADYRRFLGGEARS